MKKSLSVALAALLVTAFAAVTFPVSALSDAATEWHARLTCTTNSTGYCTQTYNHTLNAVPVVQVTVEGATAIAQTYQVNAASFRVRLMQSSSTPLANKSVVLSASAFIPTATATPEPSASVSAIPSASPSVTPSASPSVPAAFPNADNTGVPAGTVLTAFPCTGNETTVTADNTVVDSKTVNCDLIIKANNVVVKKSKVVGSVYTPDGAINYSFRIEDSELSHPEITDWGRTMVGEANFTVLRSEITGGNRGIYCRKSCTVQDSWIHGTRVTGTLHASAIRVSQGAKLIHNTIHCDVQDQGEAGCSANMTGYPDFEPVKNNTIEANLFKSTPGGYCAYAGGTSGKPYSNAVDNATNIVFKDNIFEKGNSSGKCGWWGPVTDYVAGRTGNVWTNNRWDDGSVLNP